MGDVMMLILGLIIGFLCESLTSAKLIQDAVHTAYQDGHHDGVEEERERQEILMKELLAKDEEEVSEDGSC